MKESLQKWWAALASITVLAACVVSDAPMLVTAGTVSGIMFVTAVAFKKWYANFFGAALAIIFGVLSYQAGYLANAASNLLYIAPMSLFGLWYWLKHKDAPVKSLSVVQQGTVILLTVLGCVVSTYMAKEAGSTHWILDGISGFLPLIATVLLVFRFKEQWLLWIPYNSIEVILWMSAASLAPEVFAIFVLRVVFLINSVIGFLEWNKEIK